MGWYLIAKVWKSSEKKQPIYNLATYLHYITTFTKKYETKCVAWSKWFKIQKNIYSYYNWVVFFTLKVINSRSFIYLLFSDAESDPFLLFGDVQKSNQQLKANYQPVVGCLTDMLLVACQLYLKQCYLHWSDGCHSFIFLFFLYVFLVLRNIFKQTNFIYL